MEQEDIKVVYLDPAVVKVAGFNPPSRENAQSLAALEEEIIRSGGIRVPLALTSKGVLADGHRRLAIAKKLGFHRVPCVYHMDIDDPMVLWATLNKSAKPVHSSNWTEVYGKGMDLDLLPKRKQAQLAGLKRILKPEEFANFISQKRSPGILDNAYRIAHICNDLSDSFVREIVLWSIETKQMHVLRSAIRDGLETDKVIEVILDRRRMHRGWV